MVNHASPLAAYRSAKKLKHSVRESGEQICESLVEGKVYRHRPHSGGKGVPRLLAVCTDPLRAAKIFLRRFRERSWTAGEEEGGALFGTPPCAGMVGDYVGVASHGSVFPCRPTGPVALNPYDALSHGNRSDATYVDESLKRKLTRSPHTLMNPSRMNCTRPSRRAPTTARFTISNPHFSAKPTAAASHCERNVDV